MSDCDDSFLPFLQINACMYVCMYVLGLSDSENNAITIVKTVAIYDCEYYHDG